MALRPYGCGVYRQQTHEESYLLVRNYRYLRPYYFSFNFRLLSAFYCATQICIARTCYSDVAGWLAGCLSDTRRYCIKTAKPILKLFRLSCSPIILVSSDPYEEPNSKGNPFSGALNTQEVGKIGNFSAIFYRMAPLEWPWVTSDRNFKVTTFFDIEYLRNDTR